MTLIIHHSTRNWYISVPSAASTVIGITVLAVLFWHRTKRDKSFPPGPRGMPFIGAALLMPKEKEWITYEAWKREYGDIVGVRVFTQHIVLLNSSEMAHKLLNSRSVIYSERPLFPMLDMMGFTSWNVGIMPTDSHHKLCRSLYAKSLGEGALGRYDRIRLREISKFIKRISVSTENINLECRSLNVGIVMRCFYGLDVEEKESVELVKLNDDLMKATSLAGSPAAYLVNTFPILRLWPKILPGSGFKKDAIIGRCLADRSIDTLLRLFRQKGSDRKDSFLSEHFNSGDDLKRSAAVAGAATAYAAAVETSTSQILSFILAMVLYPDAQKSAQEEIDRLGRLPSFEDRKSGRLPYTDAILLECYRWSPPGAFGLPHLLRIDDTIGNYTLPRNTVIMANIWSIFHDKRVYPEPNKFHPERFLSDTPQPNPKEHVFGYGRRLCPGRYFADTNLWLEIVLILMVFDILPIVNVNGEVEAPVVDYTSGVMRRPVDFNCRMIMRSGLPSELEYD